MRVEQMVETVLTLARLLLERFLDPEVRGRFRRGMDHGGVAFQLLEGRDQSGRVTSELHPRCVGEELTLAAHGGLHDQRDDRGEYQQYEPDDHEHDGERVVAVVVVTAAATAAPEHEPQEEVG